MSFHLKVIAGPDQGKSFPIPPVGAVGIGQGSEAWVSLTDRHLASLHAELTVVAGQVRLRDLGSRTGTFVNGKRIKSEQLVFPGEVIVLGATSLQLARNNTPEQPARPLASTALPAPVARPGLFPVAQPDPAAQALARLVNSTWGYFTIEELLGAGRTGAVFRALDNRDGNRVALKVFLPRFSWLTIRRFF